MSSPSVADFAALLLLPSSSPATEAIDALLEEGCGHEELFLGLLTEAARYLGALWVADRLSFMDVTRGSAVLQTLLRKHGPAFEAGGPAERSRSILLAPVPGEQHVFGLSMLGAFFRRAGWHVVFEPRVDGERLLSRLAAEPFDVVGLSASGSRFAASLPKLAAACKCASRNPHIKLLAGGVAIEDARSQTKFGVDGFACDAREAVDIAAKLVPRTQPCFAVT